MYQKINKKSSIDPSHSNSMQCPLNYSSINRWWSHKLPCSTPTVNLSKPFWYSLQVQDQMCKNFNGKTCGPPKKQQSKGKKD